MAPSVKATRITLAIVAISGFIASLCIIISLALDRWFGAYEIASSSSATTRGISLGFFSTCRSSAGCSYGVTVLEKLHDAASCPEQKDGIQPLAIVGLLLLSISAAATILASVFSLYLAGVGAASEKEVSERASATCHHKDEVFEVVVGGNKSRTTSIQRQRIQDWKPRPDHHAATGTAHDHHQHHHDVDDEDSSSSSSLCCCSPASMASSLLPLFFVSLVFLSGALVVWSALSRSVLSCDWNVELCQAVVARSGVFNGTMATTSSSSSSSSAIVNCGNGPSFLVICAAVAATGFSAGVLIFLRCFDCCYNDDEDEDKYEQDAEKETATTTSAAAAAAAKSAPGARRYANVDDDTEMVAAPAADSSASAALDSTAAIKQLPNLSLTMQNMNSSLVKNVSFGSVTEADNNHGHPHPPHHHDCNPPLSRSNSGARLKPPPKLPPHHQPHQQQLDGSTSVSSLSRSRSGSGFKNPPNHHGGAVPAAVAAPPLVNNDSFNSSVRSSSGRPLAPTSHPHGAKKKPAAAVATAADKPSAVAADHEEHEQHNDDEQKQQRRAFEQKIATLRGDEHVDDHQQQQQQQTEMVPTSSSSNNKQRKFRPRHQAHAFAAELFVLQQDALQRHAEFLATLIVEARILETEHRHRDNIESVQKELREEWNFSVLGGVYAQQHPAGLAVRHWANTTTHGFAKEKPALRVVDVRSDVMKLMRQFVIPVRFLPPPSTDASEEEGEGEGEEDLEAAVVGLQQQQQQPQPLSQEKMEMVQKQQQLPPLSDSSWPGTPTLSKNPRGLPAAAAVGITVTAPPPVTDAPDLVTDTSMTTNRDEAMLSQKAPLPPPHQRSLTDDFGGGLASEASSTSGVVPSSSSSAVVVARVHKRSSGAARHASTSTVPQLRCVLTPPVKDRIPEASPERAAAAAASSSASASSSSSLMRGGVDIPSRPAPVVVSIPLLMAPGEDEDESTLTDTTSTEEPQQQQQQHQRDPNLIIPIDRDEIDPSGQDDDDEDDDDTPTADTAATAPPSRAAAGATDDKKKKKDTPQQLLRALILAGDPTSGEGTRISPSPPRPVFSPATAAAAAEEPSGRFSVLPHNHRTPPSSSRFASSITASPGGSSSSSSHGGASSTSVPRPRDSTSSAAAPPAATDHHLVSSPRQQQIAQIRNRFIDPLPAEAFSFYDSSSSPAAKWNREAAAAPTDSSNKNVGGGGGSKPNSRPSSRPRSFQEYWSSDAVRSRLGTGSGSAAAPVSNSATPAKPLFREERAAPAAGAKQQPRVTTPKGAAPKRYS